MHVLPVWLPCSLPELSPGPGSTCLPRAPACQSAAPPSAPGGSGSWRAARLSPDPADAYNRLPTQPGETHWGGGGGGGKNPPPQPQRRTALEEIHTHWFFSSKVEPESKVKGSPNCGQRHLLIHAGSIYCRDRSTRKPAIGLQMTTNVVRNASLGLELYV